MNKLTEAQRSVLMDKCLRLPLKTPPARTARTQLLPQIQLLAQIQLAAQIQLSTSA